MITTFEYFHFPFHEQKCIKKLLEIRDQVHGIPKWNGRPFQNTPVSRVCKKSRCSDIIDPIPEEELFRTSQLAKLKTLESSSTGRSTILSTYRWKSIIHRT
ncbi:hypothetical protein CDAR_492971 [Caerostris darwini]|uniref:Uncharacterized protein n=1 Tax=Caerostris darwini TaxID=1538125 RepID=A0AAV4TGP2_9ARAC|nr:hypothetical protein CDAR_492971 [Caerostris darwini]